MYTYIRDIIAYGYDFYGLKKEDLRALLHQRRLGDRQAAKLL